MARYRIGNDITVLWTINDKDGKPLNLEGKEVHLYYTCERGRYEADINVQGDNANIVVWEFNGGFQRALGDYTLTLEILQSEGKRSIKKDICNAFTLVGKDCEACETHGDAWINEEGEISLVSDLDVYRISPVIPYVGPNKNWWVDGVDTGMPSVGTTAYQYAVTLGYEGSEEEYANEASAVPKLTENMRFVTEGANRAKEEALRAAERANSVIDDLDETLQTKAEKSVVEEQGAQLTELSATVPTKTSQLSNDVGFITKNGVPIPDWNASTYKEGHIKNRTHHMQDYMCHYFKGSPIEISKPSGVGYVLLAYDTDLADKFIRIEISADESKTHEFLDAMGMPLIFTWDAGNSTINVESFMGAVETYDMRAYYSSSAKGYDEYFVKLDKGFIPEGAIDEEGKTVKEKLTELSVEVDELSERVDELDRPIFKAIYGETTFAEIRAAYDSGKVVHCDYSGYCYVLSSISNSMAYFNAVNGENAYRVSCNANNNWLQAIYQLEWEGNKVTSLSSASTDTQYPSAKAVYDALENKPDKDGIYPDMTVGRSANLLGVDDAESAEFLFRPTDGDGSIKDGIASIARIEGSSVVWNQKLGIASSGWSIYVNNFNADVIREDEGYSIVAKESVSLGPGNSSAIRIANMPALLNHTYLILADFFSISSAVQLVFGYTTWERYPVKPNEKQQLAIFRKMTTIDTTNFVLYPLANAFTTTEGEECASIRNLKIIDLTQMFGAGNEPTTIEEFNARIPMGVDLNAYNEGEVINMSADSIKTVGFNQWDEEWESGNFDKGQPIPDASRIRSKNFIKILPNTSYHSTQKVVFFFHDAKYQYISLDYSQDITTPPNAMYMKFAYGSSGNPITTYNHDICIHLVHTGYRNGEYEPYVSNEKALPIADYFPNGMNAIGDVKDELTPTEAIQRIGVVDMGTLDYTASAPNAGVFYATIADMQWLAFTQVAIIQSWLCAKYNLIKNTGLSTMEDKSICASSSVEKRIQIKDTTYTDAATFKTAMSGVMLYYELAEPIVTKIDTPLDLTYPAWDFGTEEIIADTPTTPFKGSIIYEFNARDTIRANKKAIEGMKIEDYSNGNLKVTINGVSKDFMAATPSGDPNHYTYEEYGCVWNGGEDKIVATPWAAYADDEEDKVVTHKSGHWLLHGIGDLTTKEVRRICARGTWNSNDRYPLGYTVYLNAARTLLCRSGEQNGTFGQVISGYNIIIESINLSNSFVENSEASLTLSAQQQNYFISSTKLRYIFGGFLILNVAAPNAFKRCSSLRICRIKLKADLFVGDSPEFNNYCIRYAVENVQTESNIVITLHADAYARAMADETITTALTAHPNVSLASA